MVTAQLRIAIDNKWESCWPVCDLRPLVLIDLISYLLFIKKIDEKQEFIIWRTDKLAKDHISKDEENEFSWHIFKDLDPQRMHKLFTKENGIVDLIKSYADTNLIYNSFLKGPLVLVPTVLLLGNSVDIIKIIEAENNNTKACIFDYLLNKTELQAQNGQVYLPDYVNELVIALMQPTSDDVILDVSAGNCSLIVESVVSLRTKKNALAKRSGNPFNAGSYKVLEDDLSQLRIGVMNMILHDINDPEIEAGNDLNDTSQEKGKPPTLLLANLFFNAAEGKMISADGMLQSGKRSQEIYFLTLILKKLQTKGRAAVILRDFVLNDNLSEISTIRREIAIDHKLDAVISLPGTPGSLFSNACLLIFSKPERGKTDEVLFYKIDRGKVGISKKVDFTYTGEIDSLNSTQKSYDLNNILRQWEYGGTKIPVDPEKSMYVTIDDIKNNNYNFSFSQYKPLVKNQFPNEKKEHAIIQKEISPGSNPKLKQAATTFKKVKSNIAFSDKIFSRLPSALIIFGFIFFCYFMFLENNDEKTTSDIPHHTTASKVLPPKPITKPRIKPSKDFEDTAGNPENKIVNKDSQDSFSDTIDTDSTMSTIDDEDTSTDKSLIEKEPEKEFMGEKKQYTVISIAYFHNQPVESTRRKAFINRWNNAVLNPIDDKNGFVYIVYTNELGQISKGWLNKRDLKLLP
ncbi:MAG: SAM-dependent methyltransferase [Bacteroidota bacterium]|nr:SAM-dependent methyltransferase [Bacteroidota bacterium]